MTTLRHSTIGILTAGFFLAVPAHAQTFTGAAQVRDGDSVVIDGRELRLHGIDAPEWKQKCIDAAGKPWRCGVEAAAFLRSLVAGKQLSCAQIAYDGRYRRPVVRCFLDGHDIADRLVRSGWAVAYRRYSDRYVDAEGAAKDASVGIWSGTFTKPEDWRRERRK